MGLKEKEENYEVVLECKNCNEDVEVDIPKGTTITEFIKKTSGVCNYCGCHTLKQS